MSTITVQTRPLPTEAPRGARWAAAAFAAVWNALVTVGHRRAQRDMLATARAMELNSPALAQELRAAAARAGENLADDLRFGARLAGRSQD
jgi:hypothetical protein